MQIHPDELAAAVDKGANALEFAHRLAKGTATMEDWVTALQAAQAQRGGLLAFLRSDSCEAIVMKMRDFEQKRILLGIISRVLGRWLSGTLTAYDYAE